jgi:hypothetical protein
MKSNRKSGDDLLHTWAQIKANPIFDFNNIKAKINPVKPTNLPQVGGPV